MQRNEVTIKPMMITPEIASEMLKSNYSKQRSIRQQHVDRLALDIIEGRWRCVPTSCIVITKDGKLIDGQHRLNAIIKAGVPVEMYVRADADESEYEHIDKALSRTIRDTYNIDLRKGGLARVMIAIEKGTASFGTACAGYMQGSFRASDMMVRDFFVRNETLVSELSNRANRIAGICFANKKFRSQIATASAITALRDGSTLTSELLEMTMRGELNARMASRITQSFSNLASDGRAKVFAVSHFIRVMDIIGESRDLTQVKFFKDNRYGESALESARSSAYTFEQINDAINAREVAR